MEEINIVKKIKVKQKKTEKKNSSPKPVKTRKLKISNKPPKVINVSPKVIKTTLSIHKMPERLNEKIIDMLSELSNLMTKSGDNMRARVYKRASETIMSFTTDITDPEQIKGKPGIGPIIMEKVKEYLETGTLRILERERQKPENILNDVYGIGPKKAYELVEKGIKSIADLRARQDEVLNNVQRIGLKYYEDIMERIPRSEIDEYNKVFENNFQKNESDNYEIVGSYRRGATFSGDIDVIISSKTQETFIKFIDSMIKTGIIVEVLSRGPSKCLVITKIPSSQHARRVDFLYSSPEEYPFSILYFTGSKAFNTVMRGHALKQGFSINEHQMSKVVDKKKTEKVSHIFHTEKDIFDFLGLLYKEPTERIDGRSVQPINKINEESETATLPTTTIIIEKPKKTRKAREIKQIKTQKNIKVLNNRCIKSKMKLSDKDIKPYIEDFKTNGISVIENLTENEVSSILRFANIQYYNTNQPMMTDNEYDIIKEFIETKYPSNTVLKEVGAPITKNKVTLPYEMPSMDKIKPDTHALETWKRTYNGPYVISCKLDGVSGMYSTEGNTPKLYTRGDGKIGQDISHLISVLNLPNHKGNVVRGEFIIPKHIFDEKYKNKFANPRNLVSGIVNSKKIDSKVNDLHFVAYEVIQPIIKPSEQMNLLLELKHEVVQHKSIDELSNEELSEVLLDWRKSYEYEIDGVIVTNDAVYPRISGNPDYAFAFKMVISDQMAEAKVVDVIWTPSKDGYLKPRVRIEPISLGGVTIEYATGFNGKYIEENKIGIGAIIQIIRSGDVIPYIKTITTPAEHAKMPNVPYKWTDTHVDIVLESAYEDATVKEKNITAFFVGLEVDGLSSGNVKRIINAGNDTICKIIAMKKTDFENVEGFKEKLTEKIYNSIQEKITKASLLDIMVASNRFGRGLGERKIKPIMDTYPDILLTERSPEEKMQIIKSIKGIGTENAKSFVEGIPVFMAFLNECGLESKLKENPIISPIQNTFITSHPLYQKKIVMTKVRDKEIIDAISKIGAVIEDGMKKDTFALIVKSKEDVSNKTKYAEEHSIPIFTPNEFKLEYSLM